MPTHHPKNIDECDVLVVGGGTSGCMTARCAASAGHRVMLVEPKSKEARVTNRVRPRNWLNLLGSDEDWDFRTQSIESLSGRSMSWPRGRGLGGSSRINAMIWFPPTSDDWENLTRQGGFRADHAVEAATNQDSDGVIAATLDNVNRLVQPEQPRWISAATQRFIRAANQHCPDDAPMIYRRFCRRGKRWTAAELIPDDSVTILRATVERLLFAGDRITGVQLHDGKQVHVRHRVVLSAGAIATPLILMRSGIGPAAELTRHGIDCRVESPRVGTNLQDHLIMPVIFGVNDQHRFSPIDSMADLARWQTMGTGPLSSNLAESGGLFRDRSIQLHVTPTHYLLYPNLKAPAAMTLGVNLTRPESRGSVTLASNSPIDSPVIRSPGVEAESEVQRLVDAVQWARELATQSPLAEFLTGELLPGARRTDRGSIRKSISRYAQTLYHPVGTCAMGREPDSVCDSNRYVRGVEGLQIVDASVLPEIPTGNPSVMLLMLAMINRWDS